MRSVLGFAAERAADNGKRYRTPPYGIAQAIPQGQSASFLQSIHLLSVAACCCVWNSVQETSISTIVLRLCLYICSEVRFIYVGLSHCHLFHAVDEWTGYPHCFQPTTAWLVDDSNFSLLNIQTIWEGYKSKRRIGISHSPGRLLTIGRSLLYCFFYDIIPPSFLECNVLVWYGEMQW